MAHFGVLLMGRGRGHGSWCVMVGPSVVRAAGSAWSHLTAGLCCPPGMSPTCRDNVTRCHPWRGQRGYEWGGGGSYRLWARWLRPGEQACAGAGCLCWSLCVLKYLGFGVWAGCGSGWDAGAHRLPPRSPRLRCDNRGRSPNAKYGACPGLEMRVWGLLLPFDCSTKPQKCTLLTPV